MAEGLDAPADAADDRHIDEMRGIRRGHQENELLAVDRPARIETFEQCREDPVVDAVLASRPGEGVDLLGNNEDRQLSTGTPVASDTTLYIKFQRPRIPKVLPEPGIPLSRLSLERRRR